MNIKIFVVTLFFLSLLSACGLESDNNSDPDDGSNSSTDNTGDSGTRSDDIIGDCTLTDRERSLFNAINDARTEARYCGTRSMTAVPALKWHCTLGQAAYNHSKDMAEVGFFSHTGSDGSSLGTRIDQAGYDYSNAAENIWHTEETVNSVMDSWLNNRGNCQNIMNNAFLHMGAGIYESSSSPFGIYWTLKLATPR